MDNHRFINPYNFIPLSSECKKTPYQKGNYTGYIDCTLETKSPLIMIDSSIQKKNPVKGGDHIVYPETFKIGQVPAIPGSELRGMIRNMYEVLTDSCLAHADYKKSFISRYDGNMLKAGVLVYENGKCELYECDKYIINDMNIIHQLKSKPAGSLIQFTKGEVRLRGKKPTKAAVEIYTGNLKGYLRKGEPLGRKLYYHLFVKTNKKVNTEGIDLDTLYEESCQMYFENLERKHINETHGNVRPVWYEKVDDRIYLSLGQNGQTRYYRKLDQLIPPSYQPCHDQEHVCEACQVFGTINNQFMLPSRVRISDALLENSRNDYYATPKPIVLEELASPKSQNALFYMKLYEDGELLDYSTDMFWNVDFKSKFNPKKNATTPLEDGEIQIRGRKFYWHFQPKPHTNVEKTKRNVSVRPLKKNLKYKFKVYFDNLTQEQLEHLCFSISLGNDTDYAQKLGLGKPLGYGSVKIKTDQVIYKEVSPQTWNYQLKTYQPHMTMKEILSSMSEEQRYAIPQMLDLYFIKEPIVAYPKNNENGKIFEWFQMNKKQRDEKKVLPFADYGYDYIVQKGYKER